MSQLRLWLLLGFLQLTLSACPLTQWLGLEKDKSVVKAIEPSSQSHDSDSSQRDIASLDEPADSDIDLAPLPSLDDLPELQLGETADVLPPREHSDVDTTDVPASSDLETARRPSGLSGDRIVPRPTAKFGQFSSLESTRIAGYVFSKSENSKFTGVDSAISSMLSMQGGPINLHSVDLKKQTAVNKPFDLAQTPFCEDFSFESLGFADKVNSRSSLKNRWNQERKAGALSEMSRVNKQFNKIQRAFRAAKESGDQAAIAKAEQANLNAWKVVSSCVAYGESNVHWRTQDPARWKTDGNYGAFQFNPNQPNGGNLNDCVHNWNDFSEGKKIDAKKFMQSSGLRFSHVTSKSQDFNSFCGVSKIAQNLAQQQWKGEACLNPFKATYNHFATLTYDADNNFLRCTSKHLPDVNDLMEVALTFGSPEKADDYRRPASIASDGEPSFLDEGVEAVEVDHTGFEVNTHGTEKVKPIIMPDELWDLN